VIARVWFRKGGASDGFWWESEVGGAKWLCADVEFRVPSRTEWERDPDKPRGEQRHFIEAEATDFHWDGPRLVLT
jgi:hypothetical protein